MSIPKRNLFVLCLLLVATTAVFFSRSQPAQQNIVSAPLTDDAIKTAGISESAIPHLASLSSEGVNQNVIDEIIDNTSLSGTQVDGKFIVDAQGNLQPDINSKRIFDYFFALNGEYSPGEIQGIVFAYIEQSLDEPARQQAKQLYLSYINYKQRLYDYQHSLADTSSVDNMQYRLDATRQIRRDAMGEQAAEGFFALDEMLDQYHIDRLSISSSEQLLEQEKYNYLQEIKQQLPEELITIIDAKENRLSSLKALQALKQKGLSADELYQARSRLHGDEVAQKLATLDARRKHWRQRVEHYRQQYELINRNNGLSQEDKQLQSDMLVSSLFSGAEVARAKAWRDMQ